MTTDNELRALIALGAKATARPWWKGQHHEDTVDALAEWIGKMPPKHDGLTLFMAGAGTFGEDGNEDDIRVPAITGNGPTSEGNMDYIVAAANLAPAIAAELIEAREAQRWIPVGERLPEEKGRYLFAAKSTVSERCLISIEYYEPGWGTAALFTHWMPLPKPPQGGEK